jgi:hypothetical protein
VHVLVCFVDGCDRPATRAGLCEGHRKRRRRGQALGSPLQERPATPWSRILEGCIALADADSEDDLAFRRAEDRLRKAIDGYAASRSANAEDGSCPHDTRDSDQAELRDVAPPCCTAAP